MAETVLAPPAATPTTEESRRLSWRAQLGITHLAFAHNFLWTALLLVAIPAQVVTIAGEKNKDTALAGVLVVGAIIAAVTQVLGGGLSDLATFRMGRRRPFIIGGTAVGLVGLYLLGTAHTIPAMAAAFLLLQLGYNFGQAAYSALIPDRVPAEQRGVASGWIGLMAMLGVIAGSLAASRLVKEGDLASFGRLYTLTIVVMVVFTLTTVLVLQEEPLQRTTPLDARAILRHFKFDPRAYPDFVWVFVTRFLVMMGYFTVLDFLYYYVRDELGRNGASAGVLRISSAVVVAAALTVFFAGWISDRVGRKAVVYASAGMMAVVSLAFIVTHTLGVAVVVGALWGLGWGAYQSVDWALATDVLPRPEKADGATSFARYMGIWSLAITLPQVVAPAIGPLIQLVNDHTAQGGYTLMFCLVFVYFLLGAVLVRNVRATT